MFSPCHDVVTEFDSIYIINSIFFYHGATASSGPGPPYYRDFTITLRHSTLGRAPLDE